MTAPVVEPLVEAVELGPVEQCGTIERDVATGTLEQCERPADYVMRGACPTGHEVRTPLCLEHVDTAAEYVESGKARCEQHAVRVALVSVRPIGV